MENKILLDLVGIQFRSVDERLAVAGLKSGEALLLEAEPTNPYDPNAIKVLNANGTLHLGYIRRTQTDILHEVGVENVSAEWDGYYVEVTLPEAEVLDAPDVEE